MTQTLRSSCCVCGLRDERALVDVALHGGARATLCGSHALMHGRLRAHVRSESEVREALRDRRRGGDRRTEGDELGEALTQAFNAERRDADRRRSVE